jgi:GTPase SAR1 family protein
VRPVLSVPFSRDGRKEFISNMEARLEAQHCGPPFIDGPFDLLSVSFTGREMQLDQLSQWLKPSASNMSLRCLVHGMPGVGKSQLALQLAQNVFESKEYSYILWISASSAEKLTQGFVSFLHKLDITDTTTSDQNARVAATRRWLEQSHEWTSDRWLLIFDNVDLKTSENLRSMLPRTHFGGAVLFTTRNEDVAFNVSTHRDQDLHALDLQPFSESEAVKFLFRVSDLPDQQRTDASRAHAGDLANIVGRLPLAIDQAASFMKLGYSVEDLLELHRGDDRLKVSQRADFFF